MPGPHAPARGALHHTRREALCAVHEHAPPRTWGRTPHKPRGDRDAETHLEKERKRRVTRSGHHGSGYHGDEEGDRETEL